MSINKIKSLGWVKDYPDFRDNTPTTTITPKQELRGVNEPVNKILYRLNKQIKTKSAVLKRLSIIQKVDLSGWCSPMRIRGHWARVLLMQELAYTNILKEELLVSI